MRALVAQGLRSLRFVYAARFLGCFGVGRDGVPIRRRQRRGPACLLVYSDRKPQPGANDRGGRVEDVWGKYFSTKGLQRKISSSPLTTRRKCR